MELSAHYAHAGATGGGRGLYASAINTVGIPFIDQSIGMLHSNIVPNNRVFCQKRKSSKGCQHSIVGSFVASSDADWEKFGR